jgi:hypothetical protein
MNGEIVELLMAIYRLSVVKELYDQRIVDQENYRSFLINTASGIGIIDAEQNNNGGNSDEQ